MREWAMVVDALTTPPVAVAVDRERRGDPDAVTVGLDRRAVGAGQGRDAVAGALRAVLDGGPVPSSVIMVVADDTDRERFATLAEAAAITGLPTPTWVPDAVARAGAVLAALQPDRPRLVVDVRGEDPTVWGVRPTSASGRIGTVEPVDLAPRVGALLAGMLRAKLTVAAPDRPELAASVEDRDDDHAARLRQDLRGAVRTLTGADRPDDAEIVVDVEGVEVTVGTSELAPLVAHAAREGAREALDADGPDVLAVVVADADGGFAGRLGAALGAVTVVPGRPRAALEGAVALVRGRSLPVSAGPGAMVPTSTGANAFVPAASGPGARVPVGAGQHAPVPPPRPAAPADRPVVPAPRVAPPVSDGRPRWVVPALSSLVAATFLGATGVLAAGVVTPVAAPPIAPVVAPPMSVAPVTAVPVIDPAGRGGSGLSR